MEMYDDAKCIRILGKKRDRRFATAVGLISKSYVFIASKNS